MHRKTPLKISSECNDDIEDIGQENDIKAASLLPENYIADWEQDVLDPLELLMISKDSVDVPKKYIEPKTRAFKGQHSRGRRKFQIDNFHNCNPQNRNRNQKGYDTPYANEFQDIRSWREDCGLSQMSVTSRSYFHKKKNRIPPFYGSDRLSPSPSDSASNIDRNSSISPNSQYNDFSVTPIKLALILSEFQNFSASLLLLLDQYDLDHKEVKKIVEYNNNTFTLVGENVTLKPNIKVCISHTETEGCTNVSTCSDLHICPKFIHNSCNSKDCLMGHFWKTNHNLEILKAHSVASLQVPVLNRLIISLSSDNMVNDDVKICLKYNAGNCSKVDCKELHFCLLYLAKLCSTQKTCQFHHNPLDEEVSSVLRCHGISLNESPRDIILTIVSSPLIKQEIDNYCASAVSSPISLSPKDSLYDKSEVKNIISNDSNKTDNGFKNQNTISVLLTTWSHNFLGEVKIPEICYCSVETFCKFEDSGCWRLHCTKHFHWQVREKDKPWVNLRNFQVLVIEKAFCDHQTDKVDVPVLDPAKLDPKVKGLLVTMRGRSQWETDFDKMQLILKKTDNLPTNSKIGTHITLELRRLCTEYMPSKIPEPCLFNWYFLDKNKKWIEYGQVDSTGDKHLVSSIKSEDIEKHRQKRPDSPLAFQSSRFTYILDTIELTQLNLETNVSRIVRRRPRPHLINKN